MIGPRPSPQARAHTGIPTQSPESRIGIETVPTRTSPRTTTVSLAGEHDLGTADMLERQIEGALDGCDRLVVDVTRVTFIDSGAVRALVRAALLARARGVVLEVVAPPESDARRRLEILGLMGYYTLRACDRLPGAPA